MGLTFGQGLFLRKIVENLEKKVGKIKRKNLEKKTGKIWKKLRKRFLENSPWGTQPMHSCFPTSNHSKTIFR